MSSSQNSWRLRWARPSREEGESKACGSVSSFLAVRGSRLTSRQLTDVLYTASGIPGSFLGAWLVETSLGGIQTLAISTLATSLGTLVFVLVTSGTGVMLSSMFVSLAATLMCEWKRSGLRRAVADSAPPFADAVLYAVTPQTFPTLTRGTATGIASALSRVAGMIAPIVTGLLLSIDVSAPLFLSSLCFFVTAACAAFLPQSTSPHRRRGSTVLSH